MSQAKTVSLIAALNKAQDVAIKSEIDDAVTNIRQEITSLRTRIRDLTLRVTVLEGGTP
jgi:hypothetical protein